MEDAITRPPCPHLRARVVFNEGTAELDEDTSPLVVRLDDEGHTKVVSGWQGKFNVSPLKHAWRRFGNADQVRRYLWLGYGARAEFTTEPDDRSFGWVVIAHPEYVATFGGEGDQHPGDEWISQTIAHTLAEVRAYADREGWEVVIEERATGKQVRFFDDADIADEAEDFTVWKETARLVGFLTWDWASDQAGHYLAGAVLDCKQRASHGA